MPLTIIQGNLGAFRADALVNAANSQLKEGGGVCGALFSGAGRKAMQEACDAIGHCAPGEAVLTPAFELPARYVIHTVGPVYLDSTQGEEDTLREAYTNSLKLAREHHLQSIAFPLISAGIFGYPREEALRVAVHSIRDFLREQEEELDVTLVLYDKADLRLDEALREQIDNLLKQSQYEQVKRLRQREERRRNRRFSREDEPDTSGMFYGEELREETLREPPYPSADAEYSRRILRKEVFEPAAVPSSLQRRIDGQDEGFSASLLKLIDLKGLTDAQVYKRANLDRKHFSKIRSNPNYTPGRMTVLALAVALSLTRDETKDLLARAGYALSPSRKADIIIGYFIDKEIFNIDTINSVLFAYDQSLLGA